MHEETLNISTEEAQAIVNESMLALGISADMQTDPETIKSILKELEINDFETTFEPMRQFLKNITIKPQSLTPMLKNIQKGLVHKHPAIIEFLKLALQKNWFNKSEKIQRSIQVTYILEAMTSAMCNNHYFLIQAENHYRIRERELGLDRNYISKSVISIWRRFHNFFKVAKIMALDPIMIFFRLQKGLGDNLFTIDELKKMYKEKKINYFEYKLLHKLCDECSEPANKLVRINIFEAGTTEYRNGFKANALSAYSLANDLKNNSPYGTFKTKQVIPEENKDTFYNSIIEKDNIFLDIDASQDWVSLYITWNLAFILGNLNNLDLLFPKLLMPSIINSKRNDFLGVRVVSLWLSINHFLFRDAQKKELVGPKNKQEMAQAWGEINKKYALALAKTKLNIDSVKLKQNYNVFFVHPFYRLFRLVKSFFTKTCEE